MRAASIILAGLCLVAVAGCGGWVSGEELPVPAVLQSRAASDFPEFTVVDASGSTVTGAGAPGLVEQDVIFTLRHRDLPFYMTTQYDQVFDEGDQPGGWVLNEADASAAVPVLKGQLDARASSFVEFFSKRYPEGEFVYEGATFPWSNEDDRFEAWIFPRLDTGSFGCSVAEGRSETYEYDPISETWAFDR